MTVYLTEEARAAVPGAAVQSKVSRHASGVPQTVVRTFETIVEAGTGHQYVAMALPSNATVTGLRITSDAAITSGAADWGLYTMDKAGALTALDQDVFGSAVALAGTAGTFVNILTESGAIDIAKLGLPLWRHPKNGAADVLAADPGGIFWLVATVTTTVGAVGTVTVIADFISE